MKQRKKTLLHIERTFLNIYARFFLEFNVYYETPLYRGAKVFTPNHPTTTDPFLLSLVTEEPLIILVNKKILELPVIGKLIESAGTIAVDKEKNNGEEIIQRSKELLQQGYPIGVFPEGCLSPTTNRIANLHTGAVRIAMTSQTPVIPVGIYVDKEQIWNHVFCKWQSYQESRWLLRGKYYITIGNPLYFDGNVDKREQVRDFTNKVALEIQRLMVMSEERAIQKGIAWNPIIPIATQYPQ